MAATLKTTPTELPPQKSDRSAVRPLHLPTPIPKRPIDAAHEQWPEDKFHIHQRDRASDEHCPPEVYLG